MYNMVTVIVMVYGWVEKMCGVICIKVSSDCSRITVIAPETHVKPAAVEISVMMKGNSKREQKLFIPTSQPQL